MTKRNEQAVPAQISSPHVTLSCALWRLSKHRKTFNHLLLYCIPQRSQCSSPT